MLVFCEFSKDPTSAGYLAGTLDNNLTFLLTMHKLHTLTRELNQDPLFNKDSVTSGLLTNKAQHYMFFLSYFALAWAYTAHTFSPLNLRCRE